MNKHLIITLFFIGLLNCIVAQDEEKSSFTLLEAIAFAQENNANVKNAEVDMEIAKKKVWETTAIGLPQVTGSVNYTNTFDVPEMSFGPYIAWDMMPPGDPITPETIGAYTMPGQIIELGVKENVAWDITVSQLIFSGEYIVGLQASKAFQQMSDLSYEKANIDINQQISDSYLLVKMLEKNYQNVETSLENTRLLLKEMETTNEVGFADKNSVDQFRLTVSNLGNVLLSMERQINTSKMLLKYQMGYDMDKEIELTQNLEEVFAALDYESYLTKEFTVENHIDYQILDTQEKLTLLSLKQQKSKSLPTIAAFYKHQEQFETPDFNFFNPNMVGVSLTVPIFSSFSRSSKVKQAKLELIKAQNSKAMVASGLSLQIQQARGDFSTAFEKYTVEKENLALAEKIYDDTVKKFKNGNASSLEVTQAQNQMLNTQSSYYTAIFELLQAKNTLDKALNNY